MWYDGRQDVLAATEAALDYLNYLYGLFGDWHGSGVLQLGKAQCHGHWQNRARQLPEDYSSIGMPAGH